jgi:sugar-specific transcriptional regulator TrmB
MTVVRVAVPVLRGKRRFHFDKGRPWSVVEHAVLAALVDKPRRASELAAESGLPRRLVVELLVRLMRAGWVELAQQGDGVIFSASARGMAAAREDELPIVHKRMSRYRSFAVDQLTGTIYRARELPSLEKHVLQERSKTEPIVWIDPPQREIEGEVHDIVGSLLNEDEHFIEVDPAGDRLVRRFALVTVRNSQIEGLTKRAPEALREQILKAAETKPRLGSTVTAFQAPPPPQLDDIPLPEPISAAFAHDDLILGADAHKAALEEFIRRARHRLIIHSTFISPEKFDEWLPLLIESTHRGVRIEILWGESDEKAEVNKTRRDVMLLREKLAVRGNADGLRLHPFSTLSHAKFLIADTGRPDRYAGILGSCNWLSSGFHSFEASARLRDPQLLRLLAEQLVELSRGDSGYWTELTSEFQALAGVIGRAPTPSGAKAKVRLVLGSAHKHFVRQARDEAEHEIFVCSHRFGTGGRQAVIVPALAAAQDRNIATNVYYGIASGKGGARAVADARLQTFHAPLKVRPIHQPRLHAKILSWDDNHLVVTSQNWLSADPGDIDPRREIGLYINSMGVGRVARERFLAACS